jgi:hypothetical protein
VTTILVVDHDHTTVCGIHDLGLRLTHRLAELPNLNVVHIDCGDAETYGQAIGEHFPDVTIVNYRPDLMPWWQVAPYGAETRVGVLHQYEAATADQRATALLAHGFDYILALDPQLPVPYQLDGTRIVTVGRPLPIRSWNATRPQTPAIGSFGFAFPHKGFGQVAREIANTLPAATYRLHMPEAYFNGARGQPLYTDAIIHDIESHLAHTDIDVRHTADHLPERRLVDWLSANDVNCLLYQPGQPDAGLSSALDYLIAAGRPALISDCEMFRADLGTLARWPTFHLPDILDHWDEHRARMIELGDYHTIEFHEGINRLLERAL